MKITQGAETASRRSLIKFRGVKLPKDGNETVRCSRGKGRAFSLRPSVKRGEQRPGHHPPHPRAMAIIHLFDVVHTRGAVAHGYAIYYGMPQPAKHKRL